MIWGGDVALFDIQIEEKLQEKEQIKLNFIIDDKAFKLVQRIENEWREFAQKIPWRD